MTLAGKIGDIRWLLAQQSTERTPKAFIGLLTFWLTSCSPVLACSHHTTLYRRWPWRYAH